MTGARLPSPWGRVIDRKVSLKFTLNGKEYAGFRGDTVASALMANGVRLVGRSFKFHRPRGIVSCGPEEPSALFDVGHAASRIPNVRATLLRLREGLVLSSVNCWPSVDCDVGALQQLAAPVLTAGFYYKTFKWPSWHWYEPFIRRRAGLGRVSKEADPDGYDEVSTTADVVVVGGGPAGLSAATAAARAGAKVFLLTSQAHVGESLEWRAPAIDASTPKTQLRATGVTVLENTVAFGLYDHNLLCAKEDLRGNPAPNGPHERLWKLRARAIILACGAIERPMLFPDNDRPGVMLADAARKYAEAYGVASGRRVVIAANSDSAYRLSSFLRKAGMHVLAIVDCRPPDLCRGEAETTDVPIISDAHITRVYGRRSVQGCEITGSRRSRRSERFKCDLILSAGGWAPSVHLHSQAGGKLTWLQDAAMFVPEANPRGIVSVGACAGVFDLARAIEHAAACGGEIARGRSAPAATPTGMGRSLINTLAPSRCRRKVFIDLQNDVTSADIELAAQENYRSVEHLKRYTTTGMGTDQGKTSNVNALVLLGLSNQQAPTQVGTTKFRPPFIPISMGAVAGFRRGALIRPRKYLTAHGWHAARGGIFEEYGGWMRPSAYPRENESIEEAAQREVAETRNGAGVFDASPLGKIEVFGPDAHRFLDFMYAGTISSLAPGRARYGLVLNEHGIVADDGIVARLSEDLFWVNTSSGGAEKTVAAFEEWAQCEFPHWQVLITPVTHRWSNITVAGPRAWDWLNASGFSDEIAPSKMKHMEIRSGCWNECAVMVLRASFCGELSYEINVPAIATDRLFNRLWSVRHLVNGTRYGVEALQIMRIEKGYIHIGTDTDGTTVPGDLGYSGMIERKAGDFVGRRSLSRPVVQEGSRLHLVGLTVEDGRSVLPVGAHIAAAPPPAAILGHVTSSVFSPTLRRPVALALLKDGRNRSGESVDLFHQGRRFRARVVGTCFFDEQGARLNG